jgi:hydrogenase expression/formation protein HypD
MAKYFEPCAAFWRGLGAIPDSGFRLRKEYARFDGGEPDGSGDDARGGDILPAGCRCDDVIVGRIDPDECPAFGDACRPEDPIGPCMLSAVGACGIWYRNTQK